MSLDKNCQFALGHWQKLKLETTWEVRMKTVERKKQRWGDQTSFLTLICSKGVPPHFQICLACYFCSYSSLNQKPCQNKILQIFWTDTPISINFLIHSNWGWNKDDRVKLGPKDRATSRITLIGISLKSGKDSTSSLSLVINRMKFKKKKNLKNSTLAFNRAWNSENHHIWRFSELHPCLSFFLSASTAAAYIFTAPTCTATIIHFEPCALNAKLGWQLCTSLYWFCPSRQRDIVMHSKKSQSLVTLPSSRVMWSPL
jgi:hypothetical protein